VLGVTPPVRDRPSSSQECWKPAFARYLTPKYTGLQRDLVRELHIYNTDRAHQGRRTKGLTPEQALTDRNLWL
jgi:hypothetical protein